MATATATCPSGYYITGGGYAVGRIDDVVNYSAANSAMTSWNVIAVNNSAAPSYVQAQAICALGPTP